MIAIYQKKKETNNERFTQRVNPKSIRSSHLLKEYNFFCITISDEATGLLQNKIVFFLLIILMYSNDRPHK